MENKHLILISTVLGLILAGGGFWFVHSYFKEAPLNDGAASINATTDGSSAPAQANPSPNSLNVSSGGATDLGQLGSSPAGSQEAPASNPASANGPSPIDPSTFGQYDKYKDNSTALFGDIQVGNGATLGANQQASILYKGWLTNGTLFDESRTGSDGKLQPLDFTVGAHQVITGMEEGVAGMKVGGTRLIIIPPALGYGAQGTTGIPPNSVLVFEVQLLDAH